MILDRLTGVVLLLVAGAIGYAAWDIYVPYQYEPVGPKTLPWLLAAVLAVCGVTLLRWAHPVTVVLPKSQALILLMLLTYGLLYEPLGFVLSTLLVTFALAWRCCGRTSLAALISVALTIGGYLVLVVGLQLPLPLGLLASLG